MKKTTVLIVDDEGLTRRALLDGVHWEELGVGDVYEASSSRMAKELLANHEIDMALIDVEMPEESGLDLLSWIRNDLHSEMLCAFLTCHAHFQYAQTAMRLGCYDYLLKPMDYDEVEALILKMTERLREKDEHMRFEEYGQQWLYEKETKAQKFEKAPANTEEIVGEMVYYIREHLSEKLSLTDLAARAGLNPNYFNKVFSQQTGEPVKRFIIRERMQLAAKLLREGNMKSYAIAESVGYDNYANFVNMFKKTYGVSPNSYARGEEADKKNDSAPETER